MCIAHFFIEDSLLEKQKHKNEDSNLETKQMEETQM